MTDHAWIVVKVGGSLFDMPDLRVRLSSFLTHIGNAKVLILPGGGPIADAVRRLDAIHLLGEDAAHWLAIQALSINARFLQTFLPSTPIVADIPDCSGRYLLDPFRFFQKDEMNEDHVPHTWNATSDSLAVRLAILAKARELLLLKSVDWQGTDWSAASRAGVVD